MQSAACIYVYVYTCIHVYMYTCTHVWNILLDDIYLNMRLSVIYYDKFFSSWLNGIIQSINKEQFYVKDAEKKIKHSIALSIIKNVAWHMLQKKNVNMRREDTVITRRRKSGEDTRRGMIYINSLHRITVFSRSKKTFIRWKW